MKINIHNYEAFFLDHIEGRLSPEQELELMEFLSLNPDLASELTDYESVFLNREEIIFPEKKVIKKNKDDLTPIEQLIALMDGNLTSQETTELKKKIQTDKYLQVQSELLLKTKLAPDVSIRFPNKNKLKRRGKVIYMWRFAAATAAIVIIGLIFVFRNADRNLNQNASLKNVTKKSSSPLPSVNSTVSQSTNQKSEVLAENKKPLLKSSPKKLLQKEKPSEQTSSVVPLTSKEISQEDNVPPVQQIAVKENIQTVPGASNAFDISDVFTANEWNELQQMSKNSESMPKRLAKEGIARLGELTGVHVQLPDREKQRDVFAFSVGKFEVRHVSAK